MATYQGFNGSVKVGGNAVAEISEFTLDISRDTVETQSFGDSWKEMTTTLASWSGTFRGRWDMTDTNGQAALQSALTGGTSVSVSLLTASNKTYSGTAFITGISVGAAVDGVVEGDFSFAGSGSLSYA